MLATQLPPCQCEKKMWLSIGFEVRGSRFSNLFTCQNCSSNGFFLEDLGGNIFMIINGSMFFERIRKWISGSLLVSWEANEKKIREARKEIEDRYWDNACIAVSLQTKTPFCNVPEDKQDVFLKILSGYLKDQTWKKPEGVVLSPIPTNIPQGIPTCYVIDHREKEDVWWKKVNLGQDSKK